MLCLLLVVNLAWADNKTDAEAALALALAQRAKPAAKSQSVYTDEAAARAEAIRTGKPLLIRYGAIDCSAVCGSVDAVVCHIPATKPLIRLTVHQGGDQPHWWYLDWEEVPSVTEIHRASNSLMQKLIPVRPARGPKIDWQL